MNILGISYSGTCGYDTSAALVCDGRLIAAAQEERFTRRKHEAAFPAHAISFCLAEAGAQAVDVDLLAFGQLPFRTGPESLHAEFDYDYIRARYDRGDISYRSLIHKRVLDILLEAGLSFNYQIAPYAARALKEFRARFGLIPTARYFEHHRAHAASTYLTSSAGRSAIVTVDGWGGITSSAIWIGNDSHITRLMAKEESNSLGHFYSECSKYLGFNDHEEGKMMALAGYGDPKPFSEALRAMLDTETVEWYHRRIEPDATIVGFEPVAARVSPRPPYVDFAAATQSALETALARIARSAMTQSNCDELCLAGGVALNCAANGSLWSSVSPSSIWVFPAAGDAGLAVGAALLCAAKVGDLPAPIRLEHAYLGPEFSPEACERALLSDGQLSYRRVPDLTSWTAERLAAGKVVGWFQGRMEFGPRALGNRSILADPRRSEIRDRVNDIKRRERWRPLSPVVAEEHSSAYFDLPQPSPFMLMATKVRAEKRGVIPAVVHVDGTARPQTVTPAQNPLLHALLLEFEKLSGVPVLLNTSFNDAGEPIVCTPQDAIRTFKRCDLDVLVLGDWVARRGRPS